MNKKLIEAMKAAYPSKKEKSAAILKQKTADAMAMYLKSEKGKSKPMTPRKGRKTVYK